MKKFIYVFMLLLLVSTVNFAQETKKESATSGAVSTSQANQPIPLYILDDVELPGSNIGMLKPDDIESVNVFKAKKDVEPYGEKGKNGVVVIITKKYKAKKSKAGK